ncbi:MAG: BON domain-containing protein [Pseudomonadota bacterium]
MVKRTDAELRADLLEVLDTIPAVSASDIEVMVDGGMVTISGHVDTHQTRFHLERMARRVSGMRGLQIDIRPNEVALRRSHHHSPRSFS